jgi:AcrR family transcriptional regulator
MRDDGGVVSTGSTESTSTDPVSARVDAVLDAVEVRFGRAGVRALVMSDLARELGMSTKTVYRLFPSKEALVTAVLRRWSTRFLAAQATLLASSMSIEERIRTAAHALVAHRRRFSDDFWQELRSEHPVSWELYTTTMETARERSAVRMATAERTGIEPSLARAALTALVELAQTPAVLEASGLDAGTAIDQVVALWARGVFVTPDAPPPA